MAKVQKVPEEVEEIISYLSKVFSDSMRDPVNSKEDLMQDLYVLYYENLGKNSRVKDINNKSHWYILFKSYLINKYKRVLLEKKLFERISEEVAHYYAKTITTD
jgi:hypothetical protein